MNIPETTVTALSLLMIMIIRSSCLMEEKKKKKKISHIRLNTTILSVVSPSNSG